MVSCRSRVAIWGAMDDSVPESPNDNTTASRGHMDQHAQNNCGSVPYDNRFDEYWVTAGSARQSLFYCPRCGEKLPASKRNAWLDAVEALGVDPWRDEVPVEFGQAHGGNHRAVDQRLQMGGERTGSYPR